MNARFSVPVEWLHKPNESRTLGGGALVKEIIVRAKHLEGPSMRESDEGTSDSQYSDIAWVWKPTYVS